MTARAKPRVGLPEGTVTLLFADVEGSTRLLYALGDRFAAARTRMREVVREASSRRGGHEVDWAGDGVFLAFPRARDAVVAAAEIQRALAAEAWPPEEALRLRIGIHTGEPELGDEGYVGADVVVAARICASAHGEQVVVSRATRDLAGEKPFEGASYRPLGTHRLKDIPTAEQLFQVAGPGLETEFPPLRTLGAASLPALHHRLVGRRDALERIEALLRRPEVRLVTITGPGGAGKSRLALEVVAGAALERPVHLVGLAPVSQPDLVLGAIARTLDVRESQEQPLLEGVAGELAGQRALLFLDNLEHLAPAAVQVAELLDRTPDLDILATSRAPLRLSGEHVLALEPLRIDDAATLFVELAAARGVVLHADALPAVHEICRRLDGLPLAIELVAARLVALPPKEIVGALDEGLALEMEGPVDLPERQRTLRAAIDWSYQLLSENQQALHGALAVFVDGCTLEDARAVSRAETGFLADLEALVAFSLLRSEVANGEVRLSMLETVRQHALERLESEGTLDDLRSRHAARFLELASVAEVELAGPEQAVWLERLEQELDNVRAALDFAFSSGQTALGLSLASALGRFWRAHGHVTEARRWLARGLAQTNNVPTEVRAYAVWTAARQAMAQHDYDAADPLALQANKLFRKTGHDREVVFSLGELAQIALARGDVDRAVALGEEAISVARTLGDARALSSALQLQAATASQRGEHWRAQELCDEALALRQSLGDPLLVLDAAYNLGEAAFAAGDHQRARRALEDSLTTARNLGDALHEAAALCVLGEIALLDGDLRHAEDLLRESLAIYARLPDDRASAECLLGLAGVSAGNGHGTEAARLWGASEAFRQSDELLPGERRIQAYVERVLASTPRDRLEADKEEGRLLERELALRQVGVVAHTATRE